jgi:hypothetical protein
VPHRLPLVACAVSTLAFGHAAPEAASEEMRHRELVKLVSAGAPGTTVLDLARVLPREVPPLRVRRLEDAPA